MRPREMEQTARALGVLTRTLRELNMLLGQQQAMPVPYDDMPEDIDEFRRRLARRIEAFLESREGEDPMRPEAGGNDFAAEANAHAQPEGG